MRPLVLVCALLLCGCSDAAGGPDAGDASTTPTDGARSDATSPDGGPIDASTGTDAPVTSPDLGPGMVGDRTVATTGTDTGDCAAAPCLTFAYAGTQLRSGETLVVEDGRYPDSIHPGTFPRGTLDAYTRVVARHAGEVTIDGLLDLYENSEFYLELTGLRWESYDTKAVAGGHVRLVGDSFVNGPPTGNAVTLAIGTNDWAPGAWNIEVEGALAYGTGGRYDVLVYRAVDVTLRHVVARKEGGWAVADVDGGDLDPEGVIMLYESSRVVCEGCIAIDGVKRSHGRIEALGAIIINSHDDTLSTDTQITGSVAIDNEYPGIALEGHGRVNGAVITDSYASGNSGNGVTMNLPGDASYTRTTLIANGGDGMASYHPLMTVTNVDSLARDNAGEDLRGVPGAPTGSGAAPLDFSAFDEPRIRRELCDGSVSRGFCLSSMPFGAYVVSRALR